MGGELKRRSRDTGAIYHGAMEAAGRVERVMSASVVVVKEWNDEVGKNWVRLASWHT